MSITSARKVVTDGLKSVFTTFSDRLKLDTTKRTIRGHIKKAEAHIDAGNEAVRLGEDSQAQEAFVNAAIRAVLAAETAIHADPPVPADWALDVDNFYDSCVTNGVGVPAVMARLAASTDETKLPVRKPAGEDYFTYLSKTVPKGLKNIYSPESPGPKGPGATLS